MSGALLPEIVAARRPVACRPVAGRPVVVSGRLLPEIVGPPLVDPSLVAPSLVAPSLVNPFLVDLLLFKTDILQFLLYKFMGSRSFLEPLKKTIRDVCANIDTSRKHCGYFYNTKHNPAPLLDFILRRHC